MTLVSRLSVALGDRYRIECQIGAGGMAMILLATDLRHDRQVALKPVVQGRHEPVEDVQGDVSEAIGRHAPVVPARARPATRSTRPKVPASR
jgi:hypothetical protein